MEQEAHRESRRKFLKTAGKFAVYTPPALMIMSKSSHVAFAASGGGSQGGNTGGSEGGNTGGSQTGTNQDCGHGTLADLFCKYF